MRNARRKLIISGLLTVITLSIVVVASYAWFTLAGNPSLAGIQINIGGTNTIKIAPDIVQVVDGQEVHYPGAFKESLDISNYKQYDYLKTVSGLTPMSTADGIHWFYPPQSDTAIEEQQLSLQDFSLDETLMLANVEKSDDESQNGCYVYMDFWVVSPMDNCRLRLSVGSEIDGATSEGSYLLSLPEVVSDGAGYKLDMESGEASACARVGFLVNTDVITDETMNTYIESSAYNESYKKLQGVYPKQGTSLSDDDKDKYSFTIYEPNGNYHPQVGLSYVADSSGLTYSSCEDGDYAITRPITRVNGQNVLTDIYNSLTIQTKNSWKTAANGETLLEQVFETATEGKDLNAEELEQYFYKEYLNGQYSLYVDRASFYKSTSDLYAIDHNGIVSQEDMGLIQTGTATEQTVIVDLERNVPQRIRMFVWLEGQDIDCVREAATETIAIGIELAGSTQY